MAADNTAVRAAYQTLVATTLAKINITGSVGETVEICHLNDATAAVFFHFAATEAALPTLNAVKLDDVYVLLPNERRRVSVPDGTAWFEFFSGGTPTVGVIAK